MNSCGISNWSFPDDVLIQILARLPTKSVLRFRAVCKQWYKLTSSKYFIRLFNEISSDNQMLLVETVKLVDSSSTFMCIDKSSSISEFSLSFLNDRVKVRASCNGLLCCSSILNRGVYYVCNPMTRKFRTLYRATERPLSRFHPEVEATLVGLAVYPNYGRFKVVLADFYRPFGCRPFDSLLCHVFDSETNSWRRFYTTLNDEFTHMNKNQVVFVKDSLHWLTKWSRYVLVLDLDNEAWSKIHLPHEIVNVLDTKIYLLELEGSLSVVQILKNYMITWNLNSYMKEEWVVKYTVSLSCIEALVPTTFPISQTKDFVFLATHRQILIYNRKSKGWKQAYSVDKAVAFPLWFYSHSFRSTIFSFDSLERTLME
ncbi:F-box protein At5g49610 [Aristolochia californica]|uniref:F-box protein At5g49610 n=1 Tax=Aristolochia californica TaxID=171875 RepID=UPI0035DE22C1